MLAIGQKFPEFELEACVSRDHGKELKTVSSKDLKGNGLCVAMNGTPAANPT